MNPKLLFLLLFITISATAQNKNKTIGFKENKGQIIDQKGKPNNAVKYLLNSGGLNVQLRKNGFSYDVYEVKKHPIKNCQNETKKPLPFPSKDNENLPDYTLEYQYHRIDIDFVNSNPKVELLTEQKSTDYDNYYNVPNKPEGIVEVYQYKQVTYKNIYPNIDVVFLVPKDTLKTVEYNFVVHPKGKISDIQLKFSGAQTELIDNKIQMSVRFGEMEETLPASWTEDRELKKEITVGYTKIKKNVYGFASTENVSDKTVIIDPVPTRLWGTFYGEVNNGYIEFGDIATDLLGNNYLTGFIHTSTSNMSFATSDAHQITIGNPNEFNYEGIIVKFNSDGKRLWGTYYGGAGMDKIYGIKTDLQNNVIIVGQTNSKTNISTTGSYSPSFNGYDDAFLVKFNTSGVRQWGTYFGSGGRDAAYDLDIDNNNNIFMVGTYSINHSDNPHSTPIGDGLFTKFDPNGNMIWTKLYGGKGTDEFRAIKVGGTFIAVGGFSNSADNISTSGVFQENLQNVNSYNNDGIAYKFNLDGERIWSTYYGGEHGEKVNAIEIDDNNNVYIGGETTSSSNIATPNSFDSSNSNSETGLLAKLDQNGQRVWGTYLGSSTGIYSLVFKDNSIYVGGNGGIDTSITSICAYKRNGPSEGYIGKFSKLGDLEWGSYVGGFDQYSKTEITVTNNQIVVGGTSMFNDGIADINSYQPDILGSNNFYLMKFLEEKECNININPKSNSPVCIGNNIKFEVPSGYHYAWTGPNGFISNDQNPIINNVSIVNKGLYTLVVSDNCDCKGTYQLDVIIGDIEPPVPNIPILPIITGDCHTQITTIPTATDACAGAITATTASLLSYSLPGTYTVVWDYNDGNGNISHQDQTVSINSQPLPDATSPQPFCMQQNAILNSIAINGQNIKWYDTLTAGTLLSNTTPLQNGITYYTSQTINGCESERIPVKINIQNTPAPTGNDTQSFCSIQHPTLSSITVAGTDIKWYDSATIGNLLTDNTSLVDGKTYYASQTENNCESSRFGVTVSIVNTPPAPTGNTSQAFCKNENTNLSTIQISGQNIKWYDSNLATTVLPNNTSLENNKTYYASQTVGCESDKTAVLIQINDTALPKGSSNQQFCIDENATIANLNITGTNLKWYDSAINGNILQESTLQNGVYYATQTLNNCESERYAVTVKVQDTQIPIADSPQVFCIQKNALIRDIDIIGQNIKWYDSDTSSVSLTESTPLENGITYYASQTTNNCESDRIPITISILKATAADCINLVDELPFPKFFTPNNDGYNDHWTIDFAYLAPNTKIRIFDRYGKLVKELKHNDSWDGTYIGQTLPSTDYWFEVTRANGKVFKGHFSLKR